MTIGKIRRLVIDEAEKRPDIDFVNDYEFFTHEFTRYDANDRQIAFVQISMYTGTESDWLYAASKLSITVA
jgi:hypothetical protein